MTIEEYLQQPFKYDGNGNPWPIKEIWRDLTRAQRRDIQRRLKNGQIPNIQHYL